MKKILIAYGALILIIVVLVFAKFQGFNAFQFGTSAEINKQKFSLITADDEKERQIGLSNRKSLPKNEGMIFVFPKKDKYSFWMKNTLIPLDMIFINDGKIVYIVNNAPAQTDKSGSIPVYTTPVDANYVLEINGGISEKNKFKIGDTVILKGVKSTDK